MKHDLPSIDELLWSWPTVIRMASTDWARSFALSIAKHSKRRNWKPTPKQHALMSRMVDEIYRRRDDFSLIED